MTASAQANTLVDNPSGLRLAHIKLTPSTSYPANGEPVAVPTGLERISFALCQSRTPGVIATWDSVHQTVRLARGGVPRLRTYKIAGGSAGALTVTGIVAATDTLLAVLRLDRDATAANVNIGDLTSEFTITGNDTIDNTAGTATTGDSLWVVTARSSDQGVGVEVATAVDMSTFIIDLLAIAVPSKL